MRAGSTPMVWAACSTVALGVSKTIISWSRFHFFRWALTLSRDIRLSSFMGSI
ncbi:hypothetical protein B4168_0387 [Anoxybacillus flavithermus]|nr:hypothetical protein B4168_0387 [Anoxybacillus flavithermus]OAO87332.1 hypothetical protein GT23_1300 [Parageobacillus thermoglucosidasius]